MRAILRTCPIRRSASLHAFLFVVLLSPTGGVVMRFRCCGEEKEGEQDGIWVRCE